MLSHDVMALGDANLCCNAQRCVCLDTEFCPQLHIILSVITKAVVLRYLQVTLNDFRSSEASSLRRKQRLLSQCFVHVSETVTVLQVTFKSTPESESA